MAKIIPEDLQLVTRINRRKEWRKEDVEVRGDTSASLLLHRWKEQAATLI